MRVCLITNQIAAWGKIGGFGTNTRRLGAGLARAGVDIHVVVPRRADQLPVERLDGMTVHGISRREMFFGLEVFRHVDADIYHVEEPHIGGLLAQHAMPDRVHLVTSMDPRDREDLSVEFRYSTWRRKLVFPLQLLYESSALVRKSVTDADAVFVEADFLRSKTRRLYRLNQEPGLLPKPIVIPQGPFRKAERPTCVFLGRFDPRKRPELFFRLAAEMPEVDFIAVGQAHDASYQDYLKRRYFSLPNVQILGFVDPFRDEQLSQVLERSWVLVHTAVREGLPTAFQEASSYEVAVLATVNPADYVARFGSVAPEAEGLEGLHRTLGELLASGQWRDKGRAGRLYNIRHHAVDYSIAEHLRVYRELLSSPLHRSLTASPARSSGTAERHFRHHRRQGVSRQ